MRVFDQPTSQSVTAAGGAGTAIAVSATSGCSWTAASNAPWITGVTPGSGTGNVTVNFTIAANPTGTPRTGTLTVAGQTFTVNQQGAACAYSINPTSQSVPAAGGAGTAIAVTDDVWVLMDRRKQRSLDHGVTPGSGTGNGTVSFTIAANQTWGSADRHADGCRSNVYRQSAGYGVRVLHQSHVPVSGRRRRRRHRDCGRRDVGVLMDRREQRPLDHRRHAGDRHR